MNAQQKGFTLVELIVVIVILGILAATALPRFINVSTEARGAAIDGVTGALRSSVALAQAKYVAVGSSAAITVMMGPASATPVTVTAGTGTPTGDATGIVAALSSTEGLTVGYPSGTTVSFQPSGGSATCQALYTGVTGVVTTDKSGC